MFNNKEKKKAYSILDGRAYVSVSLKNSSGEKSWHEKLSQKIKIYMVNREVTQYFYGDSTETVPVVHLERNGRETIAGNNLELDFNRDDASFMSKMKFAAGGLVTTGLIVLAAWGIGEKTSRGLIPATDTAANFNYNKINKSINDNQKPPVFLIANEKEAFLDGSTLTPGGTRSDHKFKFVGHTNGGHHDVETHSDFSDNDNQHTDYSWGWINATEHTDWSDTGGHANIHTNTFQAHENYSPEW